MDSVQEFEPVEISSGLMLDREAGRYGVTRMVAEADEPFRERVRVAMNVRRASDRAEAGESLVPEDTWVPDGERIALCAVAVTARMLAPLLPAAGESTIAQLTRQLRAALAALDAASKGV